MNVKVIFVSFVPLLVPLIMSYRYTSCKHGRNILTSHVIYFNFFKNVVISLQGIVFPVEVKNVLIEKETHVVSYNTPRTIQRFSSTVQYM
jgi:hypothetical protein